MFSEQFYIDQLLAHKIKPNSWLALYVVRAYLQGHMCVNIAEQLFPQISTLFADVQSIPLEVELSAEIEQSVRKEAQEPLPPTLIIDGQSIYLEKAHRLEKSLMCEVQRLASAEPYLKLRSISHPEHLTQEQRSAIDLSCSYPFTLITGGPGTGKTYTAGVWLKSIAVSTSGRLRVALVAPTGRAVQNLERSIKRFIEDNVTFETQTLHRAISTESMLPYHAIIIDEGSMIDADLMVRFLRLIHGGVRILMLGDSDQLPPIEPGQPFVQLRSVPRATLVESRRTASSSLLELFDAVRSGDGEKMFDVLSSASDCQIYECQSKEDWQVVRAKIETFFDDELLQKNIILTPVRKGPWGSEELNKLFLPRSDSHQPVVVTKNLHTYSLMNGELGLFDKAQGLIRFDQGTLPAVLCPHIDLAYAMTVHKSQGSEFETVFFILPPGAIVDKRLIYTACTRAKKRLIIAANKEDLLISLGS